MSQHAKAIAQKLIASEKAEIEAGRLIQRAREAGETETHLAAAVTEHLREAAARGELRGNHQVSRGRVRGLMRKADPALTPPSVQERQPRRNRRRSSLPGVSLHQVVDVLEQLELPVMSEPTLRRRAEDLWGKPGEGRLLKVPSKRGSEGWAYRVIDPEVVAAVEAYEAAEAAKWDAPAGA